MKTLLKQILITSILIFGVSTANSQKLSIEPDESMEGGICTGGENVACVIITAHRDLILSFESTMDDRVNVASTEDSGGSIIYTLHFYTGPQYRGRVLKITSQTSLTPVSVSLNLTPKEVQRYYVNDPDAGIGAGCYRRMRAEGIEFFRTAHYSEAKSRYQIAKECSDYQADSSDIDLLINAIDTILKYRDIADDNYELVDYKKSRDAYAKIIALNADDEYAKNRYTETQQLLNQACGRYYLAAENHFKNNEYDEAEALYQKMVDQGCFQRNHCNQRLQEIKNIKDKKTQRSTVFTYEFSKHVPIGFSVGSYKNRKAGGYFTFKVNTATFNMLRKMQQKAVHPEFDISAGANFRPSQNKYAPIWLHFGLGYTMAGAYTYKDEQGEEQRYKGGELPEDISDWPEFYHAVSPEIGILGKIGPGVLRYTIQIRFALTSDAGIQDYMRPVMHSFGFGICF